MAESNEQARLLQEYLNTQHELCPSCRYDLHSLLGTTCPECGQRLRLRVGLVSPNLGAFIAGVVGLATSAGFSGMWLLLVFIMYSIQLSGGPPARYLIIFGVGFVLSLSLLIIWIYGSGWIRRQEKSKRILLAISCGAVPFIHLAIVARFLR